MLEIVTVPCVVCQADVLQQADVDSGEPATCIEHYFSQDPTEAWEVGE